MEDYVFISYRRSDGAEKARLLKLYLNKLGYKVFMDQNDVNKNEPFPDHIRRAIKECKDFILILTEDAKTYKSEDWLYDEIKTAYDKREEVAIHTASVSTFDNTDFGMNAPEEIRKICNEYINKLTRMNVLNFVGTDEHIENTIKEEATRWLKAKPNSCRVDGRPEDVQTKYDVNEEERKRLARQSRISYEHDKDEIAKIVNRIKVDGRKLNVLDVGCAHGQTGVMYFGDDQIFGKVIGIDNDPNLISEALIDIQSQRDRFTYAALDVNDKNFNEKMRKLMGNAKIDKFDIVFCCQVLHHVGNRTQVIANLKEYLREGGCFIIRGSDDGSKIIYQNDMDDDNDHLIRNIIDLTTSILTVSDRFYGRKIYSDLKLADFEDIKVIPVTSASSMISDNNMREKYFRNEFKESFAWRPDIFNPKNDDKEDFKIELAKRKKLIEEKIRRVKELFNQDCWYSATDYFGYGFKERD